jgi:hypothetical protein
MSSEATTLTVAMRQMNNPEKYWAFSQKKMVCFSILLIDAARTSRRKYHRSMQNSLTNTFHDVEDSRTLRQSWGTLELFCSIFDRYVALWILPRLLLKAAQRVFCPHTRRYLRRKRPELYLELYGSCS